MCEGFPFKSMKPDLEFSLDEFDCANMSQESKDAIVDILDGLVPKLVLQCTYESDLDMYHHIMGQMNELSFAVPPCIHLEKREVQSILAKSVVALFSVDTDSDSSEDEDMPAMTASNSTTAVSNDRNPASNANNSGPSATAPLLNVFESILESAREYKKNIATIERHQKHMADQLERQSYQISFLVGQVTQLANSMARLVKSQQDFQTYQTDQTTTLIAYTSAVTDYLKAMNIKNVKNATQMEAPFAIPPALHEQAMITAGMHKPRIVNIMPRGQAPHGSMAHKNRNNITANQNPGSSQYNSNKF